MPLPVLQGSAAESEASLIRLFHRSALDWSRHLGEEATLACGVAISNASLRPVSQANRMFDAVIPDDMTIDGVFEDVDAHYAANGSACTSWVLNPSQPTDQQTAFSAELVRRGFSPIESQIRVLARAHGSLTENSLRLTIIPARASFKHYRQLAEIDAAEWQVPEIADAIMLHLDDPRYDALLALEDQRAVATVGVLTMGEAGVIKDLLVVESHRGRGLGRIMLSRALEICARSAFKHVLLDVDTGNAAATRLYDQFGFHPIGKMVRFVKLKRD